MFDFIRNCKSVPLVVRIKNEEQFNVLRDACYAAGLDLIDKGMNKFKPGISELYPHKKTYIRIHDYCMKKGWELVPETDIGIVKRMVRILRE